MGAGAAPEPAPGGLSQGFSPHPLLSFGLALPTGCESLGEYLDARLEESPAGRDSPTTSCPDSCTPLLPDGVVVQAAGAVAMAEGPCSRR